MTMPTHCQDCHRPIIWAWTIANRRPMPLDPEPDERGNAAAYRDGAGRMWVRVLGPNQHPVAPFTTRYMPHFATCPHRRRQTAAPPQIRTAHVTSLDAARARRRPR